MIKVAIIEDEFLGRANMLDKLESYDDIIVVGDYASGEEFVDALGALDVDVVLLDIALVYSSMQKESPMQGDDVARHLRRERPEVKILAVSNNISNDTVQLMLDAGVDGFASKLSCSPSAVADAVREVMKGNNYYTPDVLKVVSERAKPKNHHSDSPNELTQQERRILGHCCDGLQGKEIAERLKISLRTVDSHKQNIFRKFGMNNIQEVVAHALRKRIVF